MPSISLTIPEKYFKTYYKDYIEYSVWRSMKQRCLNPNSECYHLYGGRGIKICERWLNSFEDFLEDIGPRPGLEYSIDRIDNDGHYEPGNCRWATMEEQNNNRRDNVKIELEDGTILTLKQVAKQLNMNYRTLSARVKKGIPLELPMHSRDHLTVRHLYKGEYLTIAEIAEIENIPYGLINYHLRRITDIDNTVENIINFMKRNYDKDGNRLDVGLSHGMTGTDEHKIWSELKARCYCINRAHYKTWGAIGATMCDEWRYSFPTFYRDVGPKPTPSHKLKIPDRIQPIGPGNAIWVI